MLRLFSSIRKSLLAENKTVKYAKYAVGEFLLIVAGILVALQIQNWNEERKDRAEEQQILEGLKSEFIDHVSSLNRMQSSREEQAASIWVLMSHISDQNAKYSIEELDKALHSTLYAPTWDPANSILDALIASGRIQLITDSELQNKLARWESFAGEAQDEESTLRNYAWASLWPLLADNGAPIARGWSLNHPELLTHEPKPIGEKRYREIRGNLKIVDLIAVKYAWVRHSLKEREEAIQEAEEILSLIEKDIQ